MIKNVLSLEGVNTLNKSEQKNINGGFFGFNTCNRNSDCYTPYLGVGDVFCNSYSRCQYY